MHKVWFYIIAAMVLFLGGFLVVKFPAGFIVQLFLPTITQNCLEENPYEDFSGFNAGEDIFRLEGMFQYKEGIYQANDFVTVETSAVIPLDAYRLKDSADINRTDRYLVSSRALYVNPLKEYTAYPSRRNYLYGRYYILELSDGSYVAAYADQWYSFMSLRKGKTTFPIGRLRMTNKREKEWIEQVSETYPVDSESVLYMINDRKVSDLNFWDMIVRLLATGVIFAVLIGATLWKWNIRKK